MSGNSLVATLEAKIDKLQHNFDEAVKLADDSVRKIEQKFGDTNPDAKGMLDRFLNSASGPAHDTGSAIGLIIATAVGAAAAGVATSLFSTVDALSKIGDRAEDLRLPVNLLQAFSVAADQARVSGDNLN